MMSARFRGTIEGSINVDSLQQHHELGCSVTNENDVSLSAALTCRREDHIVAIAIAATALGMATRAAVDR